MDKVNNIMAIAGLSAAISVASLTVALVKGNEVSKQNFKIATLQDQVMMLEIGKGA